MQRRDYFGSLLVLLPDEAPPLLGLFGVAEGLLELEPEVLDPEPLMPELEDLPELVPPVPLCALNSSFEMRPSLFLSSSLKRLERALSSFSSSRDR